MHSLHPDLALALQSFLSLLCTIGRQGENKNAGAAEDDGEMEEEKEEGDTHMTPLGCAAVQKLVGWGESEVKLEGLQVRILSFSDYGIFELLVR